MRNLLRPHPRTLGLFEKRIEGDDYLLELARLRFQQAGMGAEMHAGTLEELRRVMKFRPSADAPVVIHLPRDLNLIQEHARRRILDFASGSAGRVYGLVVHDCPEMVTHPEDFLRAARELGTRLEQINQCPHLFIEYAVGLKARDIRQVLRIDSRTGSNQRLRRHRTYRHLASAQRVFRNSSR